MQTELQCGGHTKPLCKETVHNPVNVFLNALERSNSTCTQAHLTKPSNLCSIKFWCTAEAHIKTSPGQAFHKQAVARITQIGKLCKEENHTALKKR
jgi:hypothetical protein